MAGIISAMLMSLDGYIAGRREARLCRYPEARCIGFQCHDEANLDRALWTPDV
jgi:hypothetical protein